MNIILIFEKKWLFNCITSTLNWKFQKSINNIWSYVSLHIKECHCRPSGFILTNRVCTRSRYISFQEILLLYFPTFFEHAAKVHTHVKSTNNNKYDAVVEIFERWLGHFLHCFDVVKHAWGTLSSTVSLLKVHFKKYH